MLTERLRMREWTAADRAPFAALNADPEVMRHFPSPLTRPQSDALADRLQTQLTEQGWGLWALEVRGNQMFIGFTGLARPGFQAHFTPAVEIGWRLRRSAWGQGYATEAATAALAFAFRELRLTEIVSFTSAGNHASRAVMQRIGMTHDAADDFDHPLLPSGHPLQRHVLYRRHRL
jgi:RimJ/RimL family protein N-acetyltransferase